MKLRNIAIIAHVDHGKTTLIDRLLTQSGTFRDNQKVGERVMDSNDLEKERGITILAKVTSLMWHDTRINIVDTPGHADFGGEVERILNMVDGAVLLVDAAEGPMPQTKFVLQKALKLGLRPIVVINKIDRPDQRYQEVVNEVFDLFAALDASDEQLDFPIIYGSAKQGWMSTTPTMQEENMAALFDLVVKHVHAPIVEEGPFRLLVTTIESNPFLGRVLTGRIRSGTVKANMAVKALGRDGKVVEQGRISKVLAFRGLERTPVEQGDAGDIVAISGLTTATVADTICDPAVTEPIAAQPIDPPTLTMSFRVNDGPLAGREGDKVQSRVIRERLLREAEGNVALKVTASETETDAFEVAGRGELQLGILIEVMRREGFELTVGRPRVVMKTDEAGQKLEPVEEVIIDVDEQYTGVIVQKLSERKAELRDMRPSGHGRQRLVFHAPTRGLIGYQGELMSDSRGTAIFNRLYHGHAPHFGEIPARHTGSLISNGEGEAVTYALFNLQDRGPMFIEPGTKVYPGMIVGEHTRGNDLEINVLKEKKLSNVRSKGSEEAQILTPPVKMSLERALAYIGEDEYVEVTPKSIRLRKAILDSNERIKIARAKKAVD
ncbi:MAG: translational GTPase TypA [Alphaproteobacteria bacterium]|nr:translational GTPase TypA [Alphaproteobacteria bacterium]